MTTRIKHMGLTALAIIVTAGFASPSLAATVARFDMGPGALEPGYVAITVASPTNTSDGVTVTATASGVGTLDERDRSNPDLLGTDLLFDSDFDSDNESIVLSVSGAPAGTYEVTSIHTDYATGGSTGILPVVFDVVFSQGLTTSTVASGTWTPVPLVYNIATDGSPFTLLIDGSAGGDVRLNSIVFELQENAIPAPAALPAGLAMIGLIAIRRRRD